MSKTYHGLQSDFASTTYENINLTQKIKQLNKKKKKFLSPLVLFFAWKCVELKFSGLQMIIELKSNGYANIHDLKSFF